MKSPRSVAFLIPFAFKRKGEKPMIKTQKQGMGNLLKTLSAILFLTVIFHVAGAGETDRYDALIGKSSEKNNIDPMLVKAVISKESNFNQEARGKAGEIGLMQIRTCVAADWAKEFGRAMPSENEMAVPSINIEIGSWYLARAIRSWSDYKHGVILALCEYNAGRKRAIEWIPNRKNGKIMIGIESTRSYVLDVISRYNEFASEGSSGSVALNR